MSKHGEFKRVLSILLDDSRESEHAEALPICGLLALSIVRKQASGLSDADRQRLLGDLLTADDAGQLILEQLLELRRNEKLDSTKSLSGLAATILEREVVDRIRKNAGAYEMPEARIDDSTSERSDADDFTADIGAKPLADGQRTSKRLAPDDFPSQHDAFAAIMRRSGVGIRLTAQEEIEDLKTISEWSEDSQCVLLLLMDRVAPLNTVWARALHAAGHSATRDALEAAVLDVPDQRPPQKARKPSQTDHRMLDLRALGQVLNLATSDLSYRLNTEHWRIYELNSLKAFVRYPAPSATFLEDLCAALRRLLRSETESPIPLPQDDQGRAESWKTRRLFLLGRTGLWPHIEAAALREWVETDLPDGTTFPPAKLRPSASLDAKLDALKVIAGWTLSKQATWWDNNRHKVYQLKSLQELIELVAS